MYAKTIKTFAGVQVGSLVMDVDANGDQASTLVDWGPPVETIDVRLTKTMTGYEVREFPSMILIGQIAVNPAPVPWTLDAPGLFSEQLTIVG